MTIKDQDIRRGGNNKKAIHFFKMNQKGLKMIYNY